MKSFLLVVLFLLLSTFAVFAGEVEDGEALFKARCDNCHQYPEPGMLKPDQWRRLLETKQTLMEKAGMQPLTAEEFKCLLAYLAQHAKQ